MITALVIAVRIMLALVLPRGVSFPTEGGDSCVHYDVCVTLGDLSSTLCTEPEPCE